MLCDSVSLRQSLIPMFNRLRNSFTRNRYGIAVFTLLNLACVLCIGLVAARVAYSESDDHLGLIWNLFLAWIPFMLAYFAHAVSWRRIALYLVIPLVSLLWLHRNRGRAFCRGRDSPAL